MAQTTPQLTKRQSLAVPERIIVATDLKDPDCLLPHAIAQAKASDARITFVHAISPMYAASVDTAEFSSEDRSRLIREVETALRNFVQRVETEGIRCNTAVHIGSAHEVINHQFVLPGAARLIMGTHGRGKLRQLALGSVAHSLLAAGDVPIFIVGPHAREGVVHAKPKHILHAVSLIGEYRESAGLTFDLAKEYGAEVTLLHILNPGTKDIVDPNRMTEWATDTLQKLVPSAEEFSLPVHIKVLYGKVAEQIVRTAQEASADWITLRTGKETATGLFNESRAFEVLASSGCPVLTYRI